MAKKEFSFTSWNIGGAQEVAASGKLWDTRGEILPDIVTSLRTLDSDIVLLQESHTQLNGQKRVFAREIAYDLHMPIVYDSPHDPSHLDGRAKGNSEKYSLSLSTISRIDVVDFRFVALPSPEFPISIQGKEIPKDKQHKKGVTITTLEDGLTIVNLQLLPGRILGFDYAEGQGLEFAGQVNTALDNEAPEGKELIVCGDFNYDERGRKPIIQVFPFLANLRQILPNGEPTRFTEDGEEYANDYFFISEGLEADHAKVYKEIADKQVKTDHYPLKVVVYKD